MAITVTLPFDTPSNYTLDGVEVAAGEASLVNLRPADVKFNADYSADEDADIFDTDGTGTLLNGATVAGSDLDLRGAIVGRRCQYVGDEPAAALQEQAAIRFRVRTNYSGTPVADRWLFGLGEAVGNVNAMGMYHRAGGGQPDKIVFQLFDDAGVSLHGSATPAAWTPVADQEYEWEINYDITAGVLRIFLDGVLFYENLAIGTGTRSAAAPARFSLGTSKSLAEAPDYRIGCFAMFDAVQHTAAYTINAIGTECIPPDFDTGTLITVANWAAQALNTFAATVDEAGGTVRFGVQLDDVLMWWDGVAWAASDGTFAELNTAADINTNVPTLVTPPAQSIRMFARLTSTDGTAEPTLDEISFAYDFGSLVPPASPLCEVYGFVRDMGGVAVENVTITAHSRVEADYVETTDPAIILGEVSDLTDVDGRFDLKLIQGLDVRLIIEDEDGNRIRFNHDTYGRLDITVPAQDFVELSTLL